MNHTKETIEEIANDVKRRFCGGERPEVRRIDVELYVDSTGDDAIRFRIMLADKKDPDATYTLDELEPIDKALADAIRDKDIARIPYTEFGTESEQCAQEQEEQSINSGDSVG